MPTSAGSGGGSSGKGSGSGSSSSEKKKTTSKKISKKKSSKKKVSKPVKKVSGVSRKAPPKIDIYIYEDGKKKTTGIRIPWLPSEIEVAYGDLRVSSYEILDNGEVDVPSGRNLTRISWTGTFPGMKRKGLPFLKGKIKEPKTYITKLNNWKSEGTKLKLIMTGTNINFNVYCESFKIKRSGGYGDVTYDIVFKQRRAITIKTVKKAKKKNKTKSKSKSTTTTYKIKSGDTLWGIASAKLDDGTRWKEIYKLNKTIIEKTAKSRGFSSSDGGHWIFPGVSIKIPKK